MELGRRGAKRLQPVQIDSAEAPIKQVVKTGDDADMFELPIPTHQELDGGPYIHGGSVVTRDPDTGVYNTGLYRLLVHGPRRGAMGLASAHHGGYIFYNKYEARGQAMPAAMVIGHHPSYYIGSQAEVGLDDSEYEFAGGQLGEPLRLVASETLGDDFLVPADAEIVIEGMVAVGERDADGPCGEHTRYYKEIRGGKIVTRVNPVFNVTAITHRRDAVFQSIFLGHPDNQILGGIAKESILYHRLKDDVPGLKAVHLPLSGCCRYIVYISMTARIAEEAKHAMFTAWGHDNHFKYVVVVDEDIDVFNEPEVLWAVALRTQPAKDMVLIPSAPALTLDPTTDSQRPVSSRLGIDATKPFGEPFSEVCRVPADALARMRLEDYLPAANLVGTARSS
jgi:UbiD family decarboxylase